LSLQADEGFLLKTFDTAGKIKEPSGICFHSKTKTLFIVGDKGDIAEIKTDGTILRNQHIAKADFEGVTHNPENGNLFVAVEGDEVIWEINRKNLEIVRKIKIERTFNGKLVLNPKGDGIEAITYNPKTKTIFVANQGKKLKDDDGPFIAELKLEDNSAKIIRTFPLSTTDLSGLHYDQKSDQLILISDKNNLIMEIDKTGKILSKKNLLGKDQEGITFDEKGVCYIVQDSGGILQLSRAFISFDL
jgi:uncharacterized protein YjiK